MFLNSQSSKEQDREGQRRAKQRSAEQKRAGHRKARQTIEGKKINSL
jgi:hypothetical protein